MFSNLIAERETERGMEEERTDIGMGGKESWQMLGSNFDRISVCLYPSSL